MWRYHPDLNWGIGVLQTPALPLGYGTICRKEYARYSFLFGAGDEARTRYLHLGKVALYQMSYTRKWCLRSELNQRHADFQSAALPTELQRHMWGDVNHPVLKWRPGTDSNRRPPAWQAGVLTDCTTGPNMVESTGLEPVTPCL